jgi:glutamate-ammonia-ligase adenylyltransferase
MTLLERAERLPRPAHPDQVAIARERLAELAGRKGDADSADAAARLLRDDGAASLLDGVFGNSPYLTQLTLRQPGIVASLLDRGPAASWAEIAARLGRAGDPERKRADVMAELRQVKQQAALAIALCDIADAWTLEEVTGALSELAEGSLRQCVNHLLHDAAQQRLIRLPGDDPEAAGLFCLGMGKLGAGELNYSSDIDLIVFYDEERDLQAGPEGPRQCFIRLTRNLVAMMSEATREGYVFRTDLRLRPDPSATPPAIPVHAAELYYESVGQNWERAAFIKARNVAGDDGAAAEFLEIIRPFVWRRHLDFASIRDIHSIKRQIQAHRGGGEIAVAGHNVKLGRGGIREIEFFAQTQQLIFGGRNPALRERGTCAALAALASEDMISAVERDELTAAYRFLRRVEHRLQMIADRQTHALPDTDEGLEHIAAFLGFESRAAFTGELLHHLSRVQDRYADLFEDAPSLSEPGNLVFTGTDDDPDTVATLQRLGFREPGRAIALVKNWHHGRYRATTTTRAREILTELMPSLLEAFGGTANPDTALLRFDEFLGRLPAGVQLFSMFHANPQLLDLVAEILGTAPRLASILSHRPALFDAVLTPGFFDAWPDHAELVEEADVALGQARDFQDVLDLLRRWKADRNFQAGVQLLTGKVPAERASAMLSEVAALALERLAPAVAEEFAQRFGRVPGGEFAIVALGKLGSGEMTFTSDLDLIFIYDVPEGVAESDGERPLAPNQYYIRLCQRFVNAITAQTAEGALYEVDMRLRPSGNAGPLATSLEAFRKYHDEASWVWEKMALTRARAIAGPAALRAQIDETIAGVLQSPADPDELLRQVAAMRTRMLKSKSAASPWEVKDARGGIVDIEFIAQYLQLRHGHDHPEVLQPRPPEALRAAADAGLVERETADEIIAAAHLWQQVQGLLRLTLESGERGFDGETAPEGLRRALARATDCADFAEVEPKIVETQARVHGHFRTLIEEPAAALPAPTSEEEAKR